ncbi:MAG: PD40 domain-containing protein, partial [Chloroflexota bacterium]
MKRFNNSNITLLVLAFLFMIVLSTRSANADFFFGEPIKFDSLITGFEDLCCFSYDGLEIYIASMGGEGDYDLWVLKRASTDEDWGPRENLGPAVNSPQGDYYASISPNGLELYFASYRGGSSNDWSYDDLYVTTRPTKSDPWGPAVNLGPTINRSGVQERSPWISPDGLELYFMSHRPGGYGGTDFWVTRRTTENDPWGEPENLGPIVNSSYYESYLSLSPDGLLLLFNESYTADRPRRPGGYGASDMWMSRRSSVSAPWQEPVNLGPKINSPSGDFLPRISLDGRMLYFCSERSGWEYWQAPIIPIVDFNGDGYVDVIDVSILTDHWGEDYPLCDIGPMPWGDGIVDAEDLKILTKYIEPINSTISKTAYDPEPANGTELVDLDTHLT